MGNFYKLEIHFLDYDTVGITAESEREAHENAKVMFETSHDHIIGVTAVGTIGIDDVEVDNDNGERTTRWD